jgi:hypothetical protein
VRRGPRHRLHGKRISELEKFLGRFARMMANESKNMCPSELLRSLGPAHTTAGDAISSAWPQGYFLFWSNTITHSMLVLAEGVVRAVHITRL